ncbi:hypothetical protein AMATHDRAFT_7215 [Amanita thiersii Skay4041]|uniref:MARVEL domain-containing protein n=1 Tax=Amanita thiersii Skay4041 TaxID=703135 RepID=A0A2A9NGS9_9AGAR|nr:hypothetical protein AMATHDRAFT_7215 [Amanita thiersii Skay4041]
MGFNPLRISLYVLLFIFAVIMLGLTGRRVNFTEPEFYDPIIVELLVTSILAIIWTIVMIPLLAARTRAGVVSSYLFEQIGLFILFVMFLVGAAIATHKWHGLGFCFGTNACNILTAVVAFSWITWATVFFLQIAGFAHMAGAKQGLSDHFHGEKSEMRERAAA